MATVRQASFAAGELSPGLYGRTDLEQYASGLRLLENFIVNSHGSALNRPGTLYCGQPAASGCRLIPFVLSEEVSYLLEFNPGSIRVWALNEDTGLRELVESGGLPLVITTTYTEDELPRLKFAQLGPVLDIAHAAHAPAQLAYTSETSWALSDATLGARDDDEISSGYSTVASLAHPEATGLGPDRITDATDTTHPDKEWEWVVTVVAQEIATGRVYESRPRTAIAPFSYRVYADKAILVRWGGLDSIAGWRLITHRVYRGRGSIFGYIGEAFGNSFVDAGAAPDLTVQPPALAYRYAATANPFSILDVAQTGIERTDIPSVVTYHQQRRVFANFWAGTSNLHPARVWPSRVGLLDDFYEQTPPVADAPFNLDLATKRWEEIRSMVGLDHLVLLTGSAVWVLKGPGGDAISASDLNSAQVHSEVGASWLDPLLVGDSLLYVRSRGWGVQGLSFSQEKGKYLSGDISALSKHLLHGKEVVSWAWAREPFSTAWLVLDDGTLASVSICPETGVLAWAQHWTEGVAESVCVVPEGDEDAVYLVVRRSLGAGVSTPCLERMAPRLDADAETGCFLDCAVQYDGERTTRLEGLEHLAGQSIVVVADGDVMRELTVADDGSLTLPDLGARQATVGLAYYSDLETLDLAGPARTNVKNVREVHLEVEASRGLYAGETFEELREWRQRQVSDDFDAVRPETTRVRVPIASTWNLGGRACLRQVDPLPLTVLALSREVETGGR